MIELVTNDGMQIKNGCTELRNNKEVALPAVKQNGMALQQATQ